MTKLDARRALSHALVACTDEQAQDISDILSLGAGLMSLPAGATLSGPAGLVPARREAWCTLAEAIQLDRDPIAGDDAFRLIRGGGWEAVLASLVVVGDWVVIRQTADDLRADTALVESCAAIDAAVARP